MSVLHVRQIKAALESIFRDSIDLSDLKPGNDDLKSNCFLTRSLVAYSLMVSAGVEPNLAAASITDGFDDNGVDAVYFDESEKQLIIVQVQRERQSISM